jgi:Domain of unknown function (DUF4145)
VTKSPSEELSTDVANLSAVLVQARKHRFKIDTHSFYSPKARTALAGIKRNFILLQKNYPSERFAGVAYQLSVIEPLIIKLIQLFPSETNGMITILHEIKFKLESDLEAELNQPAAIPSATSGVYFLPDDLIEDKHAVPKKLLWEINRCYDAACYNACAALIRRLIENLIVSAYEHHNIALRIQHPNGDYVEFGALIGRAASESVLKLGRQTKNGLPQLKFFGDLGAHGRNSMVRRPDLDRLHNETRIAIEELARNLAN